MMQIKIKKDDWSSVSEDRKRAFLKMTEPNGAMRDFVRQTCPKVFTAYLTALNGKKVGWGMFDPNSRTAMSFVLPNYRRMGAGWALMSAIVEEARQIKCLPVKVYPWDWKSDSLMYKLADEYGNAQVRTHCSEELKAQFIFGSHYGVK